MKKKTNIYDVKTIDKNARKIHRAFSDMNTDYYILQKDLGCLESGAVFYHDKSDSIRGSIGDGCLKLCWTPDGNCYGGLCGNTVIFHAGFKYSNLFKKV
jgi:hypothetical protein